MEIALTFVAAGLFGALLLQGWALLHVREQQTRISGRLDAMPAPKPTPLPEPVVVDDRPLGSFGQPAPQLDLATLDGRRVSLDDLRALGKPVLLFFAEPRCGPCYELLPDIAGWLRVYGDRLTMALVSAGPPAQNLAMTAEYGIDAVLLQKDLEAVTAFDLVQAPAAVLIRTDGTIGSRPTYGAGAVRALVAATLGLELPPAPEHVVHPVSIGEAAPALRRPDLDGNPIDLTGNGRSTLLLFWNPGCSHCQELLAEMKEWVKRTNDRRITIVTRGPIALNKEAGLNAPMILDDDRAITELFKVAGTPSAVLIDDAGIVVTEVARGANGVRALVTERLLAAALATG